MRLDGRLAERRGARRSRAFDRPRPTRTEDLALSLGQSGSIRRASRSPARRCANVPMTRAVTLGDRRAPPATTRPDRGHEVLRRGVLDEEPAGPGAKRLEDVLVELERRQDDDARRGAARLEQPAGRLQPVHRPASGCPSGRRRVVASGRPRGPRRRSPASPTTSMSASRLEDPAGTRPGSSCWSSTRTTRIGALIGQSTAGSDRTVDGARPRPRSRRPAVGPAIDGPADGERTRSRMPGMPMPPPAVPRRGRARAAARSRPTGPARPGSSRTRQRRPGHRRRGAGHWSALPGSIRYRASWAGGGSAAEACVVEAGRVDRADRLRASAGTARPRSASVGAGGAGVVPADRGPPGPASAPSGWRRVVTRSLHLQDGGPARRLDGAQGGGGLGRRPLERPACRRCLDADDAHVVGDDVVQLAGDRRGAARAARRAALPGAVASAAERPEDDRTDADAETGRARARPGPSRAATMVPRKTTSPNAAETRRSTASG